MTTGGAFVVGDSAATPFRQMTKNERQIGNGFMKSAVQHTRNENDAPRTGVGHTTSVKDDRSDQEGAVPLEQRDRRRLEGRRVADRSLESARCAQRVKQQDRRRTRDLKEIAGRIRGRASRNRQERLRRGRGAARGVAARAFTLGARRAGRWTGLDRRHALHQQEQSAQQNRRCGFCGHVLRHRRAAT